jgi:hypothetical protein
MRLRGLLEMSIFTSTFTGTLISARKLHPPKGRNRLATGWNWIFASRLGYLSKRVAIQGAGDFVQIEAHHSRRQFPERYFPISDPLIDCANRDSLLLSELGFVSVFA